MKKMTATEIRNMNWEELRGHVSVRMHGVYNGMLAHSYELTTRAWSSVLGIPILSLRPRICELHALGLVDLVGKHKHEGVYRAVPMDRAMRLHEARQRAARRAAEQMDLGLEVEA